MGHLGCLPRVQALEVAAGLPAEGIADVAQALLDTGAGVAPEVGLPRALLAPAGLHGALARRPVEPTKCTSPNTKLLAGC